MVSALRRNMPRFASSTPTGVAPTVLPFGQSTVGDAWLHRQLRWQAFGVVGKDEQGIAAHRPVYRNRSVNAEQAGRTAKGGVRSPRYAWREPITS